MRHSLEKLGKRDVLPVTNEFTIKSIHKSTRYFETGNEDNSANQKHIIDTVMLRNEKKYSILEGPCVLIEEYIEVLHITSFSFFDNTTEWTEINIEYSSQQIVNAIPIWLS